MSLQDDLVEMTMKAMLRVCVYQVVRTGVLNLDKDIFDNRKENIKQYLRTHQSEFFTECYLVSLDHIFSDFNQNITANIVLFQTLNSDLISQDHKNRLMEAILSGNPVLKSMQKLAKKTIKDLKKNNRQERVT